MPWDLSGGQRQGVRRPIPYGGQSFLGGGNTQPATSQIDPLGQYLMTAGGLGGSAQNQTLGGGTTNPEAPDAPPPESPLATPPPGGHSNWDFGGLLSRLGYTRANDDNPLGPQGYYTGGPHGAQGFYPWQNAGLVANVNELIALVNAYSGQMTPEDKAGLYARFVQGSGGHRPLSGGHDRLGELSALLGYQ